MILTQRKRELLCGALAHAHAIEVGASGTATGSDVIFRAMQEAVHTLSRLPERDKPGGYRSWWPGFTLSPEERTEAYHQLVWLVLKGQASEEELITPVPVSVEEIGRMETVFEVFRSHLIGRDAKTIGRDWKVLMLLAAGLSNWEASRRLDVRITRAAVHDRKKVQCGALALRLRPYMPAGL